MEAIDYIASNAEKYGINRDQICIGGMSGGGWIAMGATVQYIKAKKPCPAKC